MWGAAGREGKPVELSWNSQSALVYMVADLVAASDGVVLADPRTNIVAQFETPAKAIKAAKQIQAAVLEFARHRPQGRFAAAVVVHGEAERGSGGANAPGVSLLQYAKPAQVLITDGAYETLREMPGLRFNPVTPGGAGGSDSAPRGRELVWRKPDHTPPVEEVLPQATQIFVQNSEPLPVKVLPMPESILEHRDDVNTLVPAAGLNELLIDPQDDAGSPWLKRSLVAACVIVLAAALGLIFYSRKAPVVDHPSSVQQTPSPSENVAPPNIEPANNTPVGNSAASESSAPEVEKPPVPKPKPPRIQAEKPAGKVVSDFSAKDIPLLLRKAEQDAGAGKYDDAQREYRIVLQIDPNNASAKQGLRRLELIR